MPEIDKRIIKTFSPVVTGYQGKIEVALNDAKLLDGEGRPTNGLTDRSLELLQTRVRDGLRQVFENATIRDIPEGSESDPNHLSCSILKTAGSPCILTSTRRNLLIVAFTGKHPELRRIIQPLDVDSAEAKYPNETLVDIRLLRLRVHGSQIINKD
jgi:hypothetical protein